MANENIGEIDCEIRVKGFVRRDAKNKMYIYAPEYGIVSPRLNPFQLVIAKNATMYGEPAEAPAAAPEKETPATEPEPEAEPVEIVEQADNLDDLTSWMEQ